MDILGRHKPAALRRSCAGAGASLWYLPASSPDLNPSEQAFANIKHRMRMAQKRTLEDTWQCLGDLVKTCKALGLEQAELLHNR